MSLEARLVRPVSETMTPHVATLEASLGVPEAARILANNHVSGMPVVDELGVVVGVVTLTDFVAAVGRDSAPDRTATVPADEDDGIFYDSVRLVGLMSELVHSTANGRSHLTVADIMSSRLITVRSTEPTRTAAKIMAGRRVHRVLVTDDDGKLCGIVSSLDLVTLLAD